jgi:hypothetical protein
MAHNKIITWVYAMTDSLAGGEIDYNPVWLTYLLEAESIYHQSSKDNNPMLYLTEWIIGSIEKDFTLASNSVVKQVFDT